MISCSPGLQSSSLIKTRISVRFSRLAPWLARDRLERFQENPKTDSAFRPKRYAKQPIVSVPDTSYRDERDESRRRAYFGNVQLHKLFRRSTIRCHRQFTARIAAFIVISTANGIAFRLFKKPGHFSDPADRDWDRGRTTLITASCPFYGF